MPIRLAILASSALLWTLSAQAADNGFYVGAGIGQSNVQVDSDTLNGIGFDGKDTAWKVLVGIRPLDWLAVEASYVDFGKPDDHGVKIDADGLSAFGVGFLPVGPVDLFAKAGLINYDAKTNVSDLDQDGTEFAYGAGVQFRLLSLSIRGEYEKFDVKHADDVNLVSISVTYTFL